jgi:purine-binding chemotaxis protein CheW
MHASQSADAAANGGGATLSSQQFLTFEVGDELFAVPILAVQEIRGWEKAAHIPHSQDHILGIINLRGTVVPVLDVRARLGLPAREATQTTVVIVVRIASASGTRTVGCVVDAVSDVATIDEGQVMPAPEACGSVDSHFLSGVATIEKRLVLLLDVGRLIEVAKRAAEEGDVSLVA